MSANSVRPIGPDIRAVFDASGNLIGFQPPSDRDPMYLSGVPLTAEQVQAVQALVDGSGVDVSFTRVHDGLALGYVLDAGSGNVLPVMRITINAATDVIAATRIAAGGANTFETTITGAALTGEVLAISVGPGKITSVHIGSSIGASQILDADGTVTVNELGKWSCDVVDDCNVVYVRFAPPRSSGRYCDVSVVGKARS